MTPLSDLNSLLPWKQDQVRLPSSIAYSQHKYSQFLLDFKTQPCNLKGDSFNSDTMSETEVR